MPPLDIPPDTEVLIAGRFKLQYHEASGGQAEVWKAHDTETGKPVAIKLFTGELSKREDFPARLAREVRIAQDLTERGVAIVPMLAHGPDAGFVHVPYIVMEWMSGGTVKHKCPPLAPDEVGALIFDAATALDGVHKRCLHRDISPANLLLDGHGHVYIADFGVARGEFDEGVTSHNDGFGNKPYTAPERFVGDGVRASDIYSLAVVAYELLTGETPFTVGESIDAHRGGRPDARPPASLQATLPHSLTPVFARAFEVDSAVRAEHFKDARAFARALVSALIGSDPDAATTALPSDPTRIRSEIRSAQSARKNHRSVGSLTRIRDELRALANSARGIQIDAIRGLKQLRDWMTDPTAPGARGPLAAIGAVAAIGLLWFAFTAWSAAGSWLDSWPVPVRAVVPIGTCAIVLLTIAGLPTSRESQTGAVLMTLIGSACLVELWRIAGDRGEFWPSLALIATAGALALAVLWRTGERERVARIGLAGGALAGCALLVGFELVLVKDSGLIWRPRAVARLPIEEWTVSVQWVAGLTAIVATVWQASHWRALRRDILTVPIWATVLTTSLYTILWLLLGQDLIERVQPHLGSYLAVCGLLVAVAAPVVTAVAVAIQQRFRSSPSALLVWIALSAWAVSAFTLHLAVIGPGRVLGD